MCYLNTREGEAASLEQDRSEESHEADMSCLFCGTNQVMPMEVDEGVWAVCCSGCGTIGPHARTMKLAEARWNSPVERQAVP